MTGTIVDQKTGQSWSKRPKLSRIVKNVKQDNFFKQSPALSLNLTLKVQMLLLEGKSWPIWAKILAKIGP